MKRVGHVMILASAGSGKTHALTNRFVRLLADGAAPDRIVALTFTRKAAGEFFDEILRKLARAAADEEAARRLAAEIESPALRSRDFLKLLRAVVEAMPRLNLGTLDKFFARIVRAFPLELGLAGDFTLLEDAAASRERRRVLQRLFNAGGAPDSAQHAFVEAFKRATFGTEEKQLGSWLDRYLGSHVATYLAAPRSESWGNPAGIWPEGSFWQGAGDDRESAVATLKLALPWEQMKDTQRKRWEDFFTTLSDWRPGAPLPKPVAYLLKNIMDAWDSVEAGRAEITVERKTLSLDPAASNALASMVRMIVGAEMTRRLEMTRGIFSVLEGYDAFYHEMVRRAGRLTFVDVQRLLLPGAGAPLLSGAEAAEGRLQVDWRLDARFDHWLLDEFQDTSFAQWSILRNLIDEAVQDPEGRRSFFYVGDVKQSIFAWREGDSRLFREIFDHYNTAAPGAIAEDHRTSSWRSGEDVVRMVNQVFGNAGAVRAGATDAAAARWSGEWRDHTSARPELAGYAELRRVEDEDGRFAETLSLLKEIEPAKRGLTAAVIVQKNELGNELADYLRREGGLAAVSESDRRVATDNPLTCALLALLRVAAHPGDTFAREHLAMTPILSLLRGLGLDRPDELTAAVLRQLQEKGFAATIEAWVSLIEPVLAPGDEFSRMRAQQLVDAAREFDETGQRDVADFLAWAENFTVREPETAGVIRVLTVHKSKGLGFDVVILPDLEGRMLGRRGEGLAVQLGADRAVSWVFSPPTKPFSDRDKVLQKHFSEGDSDDAYESLCKFYVAMTRAKRAMYLIAASPKAKTESLTFPRILTEALGDAWSSGDAHWYRGIEKSDQEVSVTLPLARLPATNLGRVPRLQARRPSDAGTGEKNLIVFAPGGSGAAEFGSRVHELFESIEWWDPKTAPDWKAAQERDDSGDAAVGEVLTALGFAAVAALFVPPAEGVEVWRERAFEIVLDGVWLSGVFDRVEIRRAEDGRAISARVIDFKTDKPRPGEDPAAAALERHGHQLNHYRRVAAILTELPVARVECFLVLTRTGLVVPVPAA